MKRPFQQALVVGKFHPFHNGHALLIDSAAALADEVHVVLAQLRGQRPQGRVRVQAIRKHYQGRGNIHVHMLRDDNSVDPKVWAENCARKIGEDFNPDVVVTAEDYGAPLAEALGAACVIVDKARHTVPVSGTSIRANPLRHWAHLPIETKATYAHLVPRIVVVGPESTGTTTLAKDLARTLQAPYVEEYGRTYQEKLGVDLFWTEQDFVNIAREQCICEDDAALHSDGVVVCDTDILATEIWHERYMGRTSRAIEEIREYRGEVNHVLYILTGLDIPFEQDGTREDGPHREAMYQRFREVLSSRGLPFIEVSGSRFARTSDATAEVYRRLAKSTLDNTAPLW